MDSKAARCGNQRWIRVLRRSLLLVLLCALGTSSNAARAAERGSELTISLLTMGPGLHPFTKFGHTAIWVHDADSARDEVYNYGTFAFNSPTLLLDSVAGKLPYWLSVQSLRGTLRSYGEQGRSLVASELELEPEQRATLYAALRENARPENRYYRYDYYRDNCATRIRDVIDRTLGGRLQEQARDPGSMSYRAHTLRLVGDAPALYVGLDLAIGHETDVPISFWDEGFLPQRLHDLLARARVVKAGQPLPLIRSERTLLVGRIPEPRLVPADYVAYYLVFGITVAGLLFALARAAARQAAARTALATCYVVVGASLGLLGCALAYLSFLSSHSAAAANYNVLLVPPWALALSVAGVAILRGKAEAFRWAFFSGIACCSSTGLGLLIHLVSKNPQANARELCVALPLWLAVSFSAWWVLENESGSRLRAVHSS